MGVACFYPQTKKKTNKNQMDIDKTNNIYHKYPYNAYESIKSILFRLNDTNNKNEIELNNVYLISTDSIREFIKRLEQSKVLDYLKSDNYNLNDIIDHENILKQLLKDYKLEKNIKFYCNFVQCFRLAEQDIEKENEFIIVEELFIRGMGIINNDIKKKEVTVNVNKDNSKNIIKFRTSDRILRFEEKNKSSFYKFIIGIENNSLCISTDLDNSEEDIYLKFNPKLEIEFLD